MSANVRWSPKRVADLRPGDVVKRRAFGTKTVAGKIPAKVGEHAAFVVRYEDGAASLFKAGRTVLVSKTPPAAAERVAQPYSVLKFMSRTGHAVVAS